MPRLLWCVVLPLGCAAAQEASEPVINVSLEQPAQRPQPELREKPERWVEPSTPSDIPEPTDESIQSADGVAVGTPLSVVPTPPASVSKATKPRPKSKLACSFPADRKDGISEGKVVLRVTVDANGKTVDVQVLSESGGFGVAARQCVLGAAFLPGTDEAGAATTSRTTLVVRYAQ